MRLRTAARGDAEAIHRLIVPYVPEFQATPDGAGVDQYLELVSAESIRGYIDDEAFEYIVAVVDGRLVGAAALRDRSHLYHFFVERESQRQGVGRQMWEELCRRSPRERYTLNATPNAIAAYRRLGFEIVGEECSSMGIRYTPMRWPAEGA